MDRTNKSMPWCATRQFVAVMALAWGAAGGVLYAQNNGAVSSVGAQVVNPVQRALTRTVMLPGSLIADEQVDLYAKVSGFVAEVSVDIGDRVHAGQALITIDVPEMTEEIRQAEAVVAARQATIRAYDAKARQSMREVDTARAEVERYAAQRKLDRMNLQRREALHAEDAVPQQALDEAVSALAVSEAQYRIAEAKTAGAIAAQASVAADADVARAEAAVAAADLARLQTLAKYAVVVAPFDGVITMRNVDPGAFVRSGEESSAVSVLQIMDTHRIRAVLEVAEADAPLVRAGTRVSMKVTSLGRTGITAVVSRTAGAIRPDTRTMRAEVDLDNADGMLVPGMYVDVTLTLQTKAQTTMIPSKSIRTAASGTVVFVVENGVAKSAPITVGYDDGVWAEVLSGLSGSEQVITAASGAIIPGSHVRAISAGS